MNTKSIIITITLGAIGSIVATIVIGIFTSESLNEFFKLPIPLGWIIVLIIALVLVFLILFLFILKKPKLVFLLLSQSPNRQFVGAIVNDFVLELEMRGYEVILMPPTNFLSVASQHKWLDKILKNKFFIQGGFMIPHGDPNRKNHFLEFLNKLDKPVILFDAPPPFNIEELNEKSIFIGFNNVVGGELAAKAMIEEFEKKQINNYKVLIIGGNIVKERQTAFVNYFKKFNDKIDIRLTEEGEFTRESGYKIFKQVLIDNGKNFKDYQGIYCTNDEMALGVLELMNETQRVPREDLVLIGYDATNESISLINSNTSVMKNSVNQDSKKLAELCVEQFINIRKGNLPNTKEILIPPRLFKNI